MPPTRRLRAVATALLLLAAPVASAEAQGLTRLHTAVASTLAANIQLDLNVPTSIIRDTDTRERPKALAPLYVSFVALQVMDADSTADAIRAGYGEGNPFMGRFADNTGAMIAVKAVSTVGTIYAVEKLWRKNPVAAVLVMTAINAGYAVVVANNYSRVRGR